ncbi:MAG: ATP-binding protein [Pseudomonadota bacterium]
MFGRLGFLGRLLLIVFALLIAFLALAVAMSFISQERRTIGTERFPVPAQAAAIVELLDRTSEPQRPGVLRAVSNERFLVSLTKDAISEGPTASRMPAVEWLVGQYLETLPDRQVRVFIGKDARMGWIARGLERFRLSSRTPISIQVALRDGSFATFRLRGDSTRRVFGIPAGFWLGVIGCLLAAVAMWAIVREARPLSALAQSVEDFSEDGEPRSVDPQGAPEIRHLISASNAMQSRIAALLKGRTMLLGAISHDLKTYVTRLRLRAEFISPQDQQDRAVRDLDDMTDLIDTALAVARGTLTADRREHVDVFALVREEVERRPNERITVAPEQPDRSANINGDPVSLKSVIANLLDNAARYADSCRVTISNDAEHVSLTIEDDGPGIADAERETVFEPFYRLDPSRNKATGGSGLGLAIAKQIVEGHGGRISLDASELGGARFQVTLPAA